MKSPVEEKDYRTSHPEKYSGRFLNSPVVEEMYRKVHPMTISVEREMRGIPDEKSTK